MSGAPATLGERSGITVQGEWQVTNVSDRNFVLLRVRLANHEAHANLVLTEAEATRNGRRQFGTGNPIRARTMSAVVAHVSRGGTGLMMESYGAARSS